MPELSLAVTCTSSESPPFMFGLFETAFEVIVIFGAGVSAMLTMIESVLKLSDASPAVGRMTVLSPSLRPDMGTATVRVLVFCVGLNVDVSAPITEAPLFSVVFSVCTPLSSVAVTMTLSVAPRSTTLLVPAERANLMVGAVRSPGSPPLPLPPGVVGSRESQLATRTPPRTSAASRAGIRRKVICAPRGGLAPPRLGGLLAFVDDMGGNQHQQVSPRFLPIGVAEQPPDDRKVDEQGNAGLRELHGGLREAADDDRLPVGHEERGRRAVVVDQRAVRREGGAGVDGFDLHHDLPVVRHARRDAEGDAGLHAFHRDWTGERGSGATSGRHEGHLRTGDQLGGGV